MRAFRLSLLLMLVLVFIFVAVGTGILYTTFPEVLGGPRVGWRLFACLLTGWLIGFLVIESTAYYTTGSPQKSVAAAGITGPGTIMIQVRRRRMVLMHWSVWGQGLTQGT
jgi:Na+/H+-translocating membrane pyrophosphatase